MSSQIALDPRDVELRFRKSAFALCGCVSFTLVGYVSYQAVSIFSVDLFQLTLDESWGNFPDFQLCSYDGHQVKWAFAEIHGGNALKQLVSSSRDPANPFSVEMQAIRWRDTVSERCLLFKTSVLTPRFSEGVPRLNFKVTFESKWDETEVDVEHPYMVSDLRLMAVDSAGHSLGGVAFPHVCPVTADRWRLTSTKVTKKRLDDHGVIHDYFKGNAHVLTIKKIGPPRHKVHPVQEHYKYLVSQISEDKYDSQDLWVTAFEVVFPTFSATTVPVFAKVSKLERFLHLFTRVGGALTLIGVILKRIFPTKFPRSNIRSTYDVRTLLGYRCYDTEIIVDSKEEMFHTMSLTRGSGSSGDDMENIEMVSQRSQRKHSQPSLPLISEDDHGRFSPRSRITMDYQASFQESESHRPSLPISSKRSRQSQRTGGVSPGSQMLPQSSGSGSSSPSEHPMSSQDSYVVAEGPSHRAAYW